MAPLRPAYAAPETRVQSMLQLFDFFRGYLVRVVSVSKFGVEPDKLCTQEHGPL